MQRLIFELSGYEFKPSVHTKMLGVIHKWIGKNEIHDEISLYSFSHVFNNQFMFSAFDETIIEKIKYGSIKHPEMFDNCKLIGYRLKSFDVKKESFRCASPFFVKDENNKHLIFKEAEEQAKKTLIKKAKIANIELGEFDLQFVNFRKTKLIKIHDIENRCFVSEVKIIGSDTVKMFACQVGIGNSTGAGFGFIY